MSNWIARLIIGLVIWYVLKFYFLWNTNFNPTVVHYTTLVIAVFTSNQIFPDKN